MRGSKRLLKQEEVFFAPPGENTFGLGIIKETWVMENGQEKTYWLYYLSNTVQIVALTTQGKVIAISEFQAGVGVEYLHLPGETMEQGETPLDAAQRGLLEETGYKTGSVELLSSILENSARSHRLMHVVIALDCIKSQQEGEEQIQTVLLEPVDFWAWLIEYFLNDPNQRHGGGNTLKAAALAFYKLGLLKL